MAKKPDKPRPVRCAIYTRKSTEDGLEQEFNSLDAQREAAENFIASQKHEGWRCLLDRYDDGGFTGGDMERPALRRLLADVEEKKIDCIVVYKVDRLSRSLLDFARIVGTLEESGASFVSVTQQFNTSSSMGRLTLNILLSFAQFEREIISERTRDKIAATKKKGKWAGGAPVLGYNIDREARRLVVNRDEARRVKAIFKLYLDHQSLMATIREIDARGWVNKRWITKKRVERGGKPFTRTSLASLLSNPIYLGKVAYKDELYEGEHDALIDQETFRKVRRQLNANRTSGGAGVRNRYGALLKGLLRCAPCGSAMSHTYTAKGSRRYRYYVCVSAQKRGWEKCPSRAVPAGEMERFVVEQIRAIGSDPVLIADTVEAARRAGEEERDALIAEKASIARELRRISRELARLVPGSSEGRKSDLDERVRVLERRKAEIGEKLQVLDSELPNEEEVRRALSMFEPVWEVLAPRDRVRIIGMMVQGVDYDGGKETVSVHLHAAGMKAFSEEQQEASA